MIALRTITVAVGAVVVAVVCLLLVMIGTFVVGDVIYESVHDASYGLRASVAVAMLSVWSLVGGGAALMSLRLGARRLRASLLGAIFIVATLSGLALYPFLAYATYINDCAWNVAFPLGGRFECGR